MKSITHRKSKYKSYVGSCLSKTHHGYLTLEALCQHDCLEKGCKQFRANLEHPLFTDEQYTSKKITFKKLLNTKKKATALREYVVSEEKQVDPRVEWAASYTDKHAGNIAKQNVNNVLALLEQINSK